MGKVETDTRPKNGLRYHQRPIFNHSLCDLLFLLQSMLMLASKVVNMDDIERSNVNRFCFSFKQKEPLDIGALSSLDYAAFSVSGRAFFLHVNQNCSPNSVKIGSGNLLCRDLVTSLHLFCVLEGSHYANGPSSLNYIFTT